MPLLKFVHVQWAADGRWSEALRRVPGQQAEVQALPPRLVEADDLAFELFFAGPGGPSCYVGLRHAGALDQRHRFVAQTLSIAEQVGCRAALRQLDRLCSVRPAAIVERAASLELGVVDLWREFGPLALPPKIAPGAELDEALATRPDLTGPRRHWLALEWLADVPMPCWVGTRVSGDGAPLSSSALEAALREGPLSVEF